MFAMLYQMRVPAFLPGINEPARISLSAGAEDSSGLSMPALNPIVSPKHLALTTDGCFS